MNKQDELRLGHAARVVLENESFLKVCEDIRAEAYKSFIAADGEEEKFKAWASRDQVKALEAILSRFKRLADREALIREQEEK